jgi:CubicO group peptidase (beta-lactamase class C family)
LDTVALAAVADRLFAPFAVPGNPGCVVGVAHGGRPLLRRAYGLANLETGTPLTPASVLESGSVAKQFTAAATIRLAMQGRLRLDDSLGHHWPGLPAPLRGLTIRQLLSHTSGLREWSTLVEWQGWPRGRRAHTQEDLLALLQRQRGLNHPPGVDFSYTNSGFALVPGLLERLTGRSFRDVVRREVFAPAGLIGSDWRDDFTRVLPGRAQAYARRGGVWVLDMPFEDVVGPGGMLTTVDDWLRWPWALARGDLGPGLLDSLATPTRLRDGRPTRYGLGLYVGRAFGTRELWHTGATAGYRTALLWYPERDVLTVAVLCNAASANPRALARRLAAVALGAPPDNAPPGPPLPSSAARAFLGVYRDVRTNVLVELDSAAVAQLRRGPDGWAWGPGGEAWRWSRSPVGGPVLLRRDADGDTAALVRLAAARWRPRAVELAPYVGRYRSDELGATAAVTLEDDTLRLEMDTRPGRRWTLLPRAPDHFLAGSTTLRFERDATGRVVALHLAQSRVWDLRLERLFIP